MYKILPIHFRLLLLKAPLALLLSALSPGYAQAYQSDKKPILADALAPFDSDFAEIHLNDKRQYLHRSGRIMVDKFIQHGAPIAVAVKNGAYGAINRKGDVIADFQYDGIYSQYGDNGKSGAERAYTYFLAIVQLNGKLGAIDTTGMVVAEPIYEKFGHVNEQVIAAMKSGKWGLLSLKDGSTVLPFIYDGFQKAYELEGPIKAVSNGKSGLFAANGLQKLIAPIYDDIGIQIVLDDTLIVAQNASNSTLFNTSGRPIAEVPYDFVRSHGPLLGVEKDGLWGWISATGETIIPPTYEKTSTWLGKLYVVSQHGLAGVVAADGTTVTPCKYDEVQLIDTEGNTHGHNDRNPLFIGVKQGGKQGLLNTEGQVLLPTDYDQISVGNAGGISFVQAVKDSLYGIFDQHGNELIPFTYRQPAYGFGPSVQGMPSDLPLIALPDGELAGLYNLKKKEWLLKPKYHQLEWQRGAFIKASIHNTGEPTVSAYFNSDGTQLLEPTEYLFVDAADTDRYVVKENSKGRWISTVFDRQGKQIYSNKDWNFEASDFYNLLIPDSLTFSYYQRQFDNGLLKVTAENNLFIDRSGVEHRFTDMVYVGDFYNGLAIAGKMTGGTERVGIIDTTGRMVLPVVYTDINRLFGSDFLRVANEEDKYGLIDRSGTVRIEAQYDQIESINHQKQDTLLVVELNGKKGIVDDYGQPVIPLEYDNIKSYGDFFIIERQGKKGFAASDGTIWVAPMYDEIRLNNSYAGYFPALVRQGEQWTYIDPTPQGQAFHIIGKTKLGY
ncbi:WG repeat-containing protein [Sinomicrobium sp.]